MTDCAAPRHQDQAEPTPAKPHGSLCLPCERGLARDLRRLPALHADLQHIPAINGGDGTGLPFSEPAADCRSQIRHDLTYWARHITQLRGLDAPPVLEDGWSERPVTVMCGWLAGQVTWCSFRDWAPDMADALGSDRARAVALLDPWLVKQFELPGPDGACLDCAEGRMGITIYVWPEDRRQSFIGCPVCGARWEFGGAWLPFVRQVIRRRNAAQTTTLTPVPHIG
jgi:hypothetical protein